MQEHKETPPGEPLPTEVPAPRPSTGGMSAAEAWLRDAKIVKVEDEE